MCHIKDSTAKVKRDHPGFPMGKTFSTGIRTTTKNPLGETLSAGVRATLPRGKCSLLG